MRSMMSVVCAALLGGLAHAYAQNPPATQNPPAQNPPAQQQPAAQPPSPFVYQSDAGMIFATVKPDQTAAFEEVIGKLKEALAKSDKPQRKQQAATWKIFKAQEAAQGNVMYIFIMDPVVKDADYEIVRILTEAYPTEVQAMYEKLKAALAGLNRMGLQKVVDMGGAAPAPAPAPGGGRQ